MLSTLVLSLLAFLFFSIVSADYAKPVAMTWSDTTYGPDGPWYALSIQIGSPPHPVDVYPSSSSESWIPNQHYCSNKTFSSTFDIDCSANHGIWNFTKSTSVRRIPYGDRAHEPLINIPYFALPLSLKRNGTYALDTVRIRGSQFEVPKCAILSLDWAYYRNHVSTFATPFNVGVLGLAGKMQSVPSSYNAQLTLPHLYKNTKIPSESYGLHVGSVKANIPPSLYLGGYDQRRILGRPLKGPIQPQPDMVGKTPDVHSHGSFLMLKDINIKTVVGHSPARLPPSDQSLLSITGDSQQILPIQVNFNPSVPYMFLPSWVCQNFASVLPVKLDFKTGYYLWKTNHPDYHDIMNSTSYVDFTFKSNLTDDSISIRAPWKLFDLELDSPIVSTSTRYFPCIPATDGTYSLGRALLQSTYLTFEWGGFHHPSYFYIAQSPGPNIKNGPLVRPILADYPEPLGDYSVTWESTWGFPEPVDSAASSASQISHDTQVGLGILIGLVLPLFLGLAAFIFISRRRARAEIGLNKTQTGGNSAEASGIFGAFKRFLFGSQVPVRAEVANSEIRAEVEAKEIAEVEGGEAGIEAPNDDHRSPVELAASPFDTSSESDMTDV